MAISSSVFFKTWVASAGSQRRLEFVRDVAEGAVEIHAGAEVEASERHAVHDLRQADRIRGRDQDHFTVDAGLEIEALEFAP